MTIKEAIGRSNCGLARREKPGIPVFAIGRGSDTHLAAQCEDYDAALIHFQSLDWIPVFAEFRLPEEPKDIDTFVNEMVAKDRSKWGGKAKRKK